MSPKSVTFTPTPDQLALREARRLKKLKAATNADVTSSTTPSSLVNDEKGRITARPWLAVQGSLPNSGRRVKIMTWNVRRLLFPPYCQLPCPQRPNVIASDRVLLHTDTAPLSS
jgi:RNA exonuclease NGL2